MDAGLIGTVRRIMNPAVESGVILPVNSKRWRTISRNTGFLISPRSYFRRHTGVPRFPGHSAPGRRTENRLAGVAVVPIRNRAIFLMRHYRHTMSDHVWK